MDDGARRKVLELLDGHPSVVDEDLKIAQQSGYQGIGTYSVIGETTKLLVKIAEPTEDNRVPNTASILREATVLTAVAGLHHRFQPDLLVHHGSAALTMKWIDGAPAFQLAQALAQDSDETSLIDLLWDTLSDLGDLHTDGWAHGDLQPSHFRAVDAGVALLNYGYAQKNGLPAEDYEGGAVDFTAPEVAHQVASFGRATATPASDVFSLGAVFTYAITGEFIGWYGEAESRQQKLERLADGGLRMDLVRRALEACPLVRSVLEAMLEVDPARRPQNAVAVMGLLPVVESPTDNS